VDDVDEYSIGGIDGRQMKTEWIMLGAAEGMQFRKLFFALGVRHIHPRRHSALAAPNCREF
jgi:hypothetical protein